jgi:hypothetical protein
VEEMAFAVRFEPGRPFLPADSPNSLYLKITRKTISQKFVIAFASGNCYESACCGWLSTRLHRFAKHYGQVAKRRAMPSLLRHEKTGGHH